MTFGTSLVEFFFWQDEKHKWSNIYFYSKESSWNPNSSTLQPERSQHDCPAACVIAQQYSSTTAFSLRLHSRKEKLAPF